MMNERIFELAEQAGCDILFNDDGSGIAKEDGIFFDVESFEKFAELIVKECAKLADEPTSHPFQSYGVMIKEHFGVEDEGE